MRVLRRREFRELLGEDLADRIEAFTYVGSEGECEVVSGPLYTDGYRLVSLCFFVSGGDWYYIISQAYRYENAPVESNDEG